MTIAEMVKRRRIELGMSQRQLAAVSGLSNSEISRIESGERKSPSPKVLLALASALDIPYEVLMQEAGHRPLPDAPPKIPEWVYSLPRDLYGFVKEEAERGWPYIRLARGMREKDLSPEDLEAIVAAWVEARRKYDKGFSGKE
ncbi:MAG TPA: helix-turn-helix transcriptional regulator [Firmicutes bacterium]|nr:helix-turn-helix transcriptional regulator [Candidatus Fermentithermobacillaceae bacterium]